MSFTIEAIINPKAEDDEFPIVNENHIPSKKEYLDYLKQGEVEMANEVYHEMAGCYD